MSDPVVDARGVAIAPGDTVIYGFGVSRSVAMAEAVVLGECKAMHVTKCSGPECPRYGASLTASGRVRLRVVRRSYSSGEKPIVDVAPGRLVVLKQTGHGLGRDIAYLPPSPLPTQDEVARAGIEKSIAYHNKQLRDLGNGGPLPQYVRERLDRDGGSEEVERVNLMTYHISEMANDRRKLRDLDDN